jgi:aminopeptidase-like protein
MFHLISWSDGEHDLISIAEKRNESIKDYFDILEQLIQEQLIAIK